MPDVFSDEEIGLTPLSDEDIGLKQLAADELKRKTFEAKIEGQQAKTLSALTDIGTEAAKGVVRAFSYIDPTGFSQGLMNQYGVEPVHVIPPEKVLPDVQTVSEFAREGLQNIGVDLNVVLPEQYRKPVEEFAAENIAALPEMAPLMTAGVAAPKPVARVFQAQMLRGVPESAYQAATAETPEERVKAGLGAAAGLAFPALIEHGIRERPTPIPDIPGSRLEQQRGALPAQPEAAPIERATPEQAAAQAEQMTQSATASLEPKSEIKSISQKVDYGKRTVTKKEGDSYDFDNNDDLSFNVITVDTMTQSQAKEKFGKDYSVGQKIVSQIVGVNGPKPGIVVAEIIPDKTTAKPATEPSILAPEKPEVAPVEKPVEEPTKVVEAKPVEPLSDEQIGLAKEAEFTKPAEAPVEEVATVEPAAEQIPQGPGARTGTTAQAPESYEGTGLKNAIGEVERVSYGLPEATPTQRRAMGEAWIKSARVLQDNPLAGERLVSELRNNPKRALTDEDSAVLLRHKVSLENEMNRAAELTNIAEDPAIKAENQARYQMLSDQLLELLDMAKARGSEWGREGRWRQAIANQDYSLATMESRTRASLGGRRLTESERSKLQKDYDELKASQKAYEDRIAKHEAEVEELQLKLAQEKAARAEAGEGPAIHPTILKIANDIVSKLDTAADRARARIRERATRFSAGIDPTVILDLTEIGASHLAHKVLDFAKWSDRMIGEFGDWVKPHLEEVFAKSQKAIDDLAERHGKSKATAVKRALKEPTAKEVGDAVAEKVRDRIQKKELSAISAYLQRLARALWKEGVRDRDEIVKQMHGFISQKVPDITTREVSRMWSGYGDYRQLSKDEISVGLRKLKGELLETHKLEDMAEGRPPLKSGSERGEISEARRQLIKKVNDAKYKFQIPIEDPNTQLKSALDTYKTTLQNRIADLEDRMARKDYAPRVRRELVLDETAMDLKAKNLRVRQRFEQELEKNRLANRKPWQKLLDNFVRWERAFKLSSPVVFGKLGAAAMTRLATTTAEEAVGAGLGKLPVISEVAKRAPREGGISIEGMSKGLAAMVTKGIQDAKQTAKSGMTDLDILLGKEGGLDREWVNVFGQLHGMMKAPIKRFEYELSLQKRIEAAMRNGEDVRNREVMLRLMTEAMNDGYRSIFMQRGFTADLFNTALHMAETSKKYQPQGEIFARTMRFLLPIVRVPINIVAETATGITGIPVASARIMFHAINGSLKTMDPKVADAIMRQFKKGSIGAGLMAIGFMNPDNIGGYDWREKRGPNAPKAGGFQLFGWNVPRWMTHAPWFELMQFGATLRHAVNNKKKGLGDGALAASVGLVEQTPFYGEMMRVTQAGESGTRFGAFAGELARSTIVPQALQKIAEWTDFTDKKRKPKNWYQHVMYGVPGLRQYVPEQTTNSDKF